MMDHDPRDGESDSIHAALTVRCGMLLTKRGLQRFGLLLLRRGLRATPTPRTDAVALLARGLLRMGDPDGARYWFAELDRRRPAAPDGALGLAQCANAARDWDVAADAWTALIRRFPGDRRASGWRRNLRQALERAGRREDLEIERAIQFAMDERMRRYVEVMTNSRSTSRNLRFQHVVIVTYGRSGSTLLQGVLNSIDGVLVRGENGNLFTDFQRIARRAAEISAGHPDTHLPLRPWFGASALTHDVVMGALRAAARSLLVADHPDDGSIECLGFKEIRFGDLGDELEAHLDFLGDLLPGLAYIFNTRDVTATARSGWWASRDRRRVISELESLERRFVSYARGREDCYHIRYEDVTARNDRLQGLHEFLGAPYEMDRIEAVLDVPHSWSGSSPGRQKARG